jgi:hypothetical protein
LIKGRNVGIIMTHRGEYTNDDNIGRNLTEAYRFGHVQIRGHYIETDERGNERHIAEQGYLLINGDSDDSGNLKGYLREQSRQRGLPYVLFKQHNSETAWLISTGPREISKTDIGEFRPGWVSEYGALIYGENIRLARWEEFNYYNFKSFFRSGGLFL